MTRCLFLLCLCFSVCLSFLLYPPMSLRWAPLFGSSRSLYVGLLWSALQSGKIKNILLTYLCLSVSVFYVFSISPHLCLVAVSLCCLAHELYLSLPVSVSVCSVSHCHCFCLTASITVSVCSSMFVYLFL